MRTLCAVAVMAAVLLSGAAAFAQDCYGGASETRTTEFRAWNPVILKVGMFESAGCGAKYLEVVTNSRTKVAIQNTDFIRYERDWDGNLLSTFDTIEAMFLVRFIERPATEEGSPMEVRDLGDGLYGVNPHRGGYLILLGLAMLNPQIWDDAGCYVAKASVTITAEPHEDCRVLEE